jgi:hypothetical protein
MLIKEKCAQLKRSGKMPIPEDGDKLHRPIVLPKATTKQMLKNNTLRKSCK